MKILEIDCRRNMYNLDTTKYRYHAKERIIIKLEIIAKICSKSMIIDSFEDEIITYYNGF
jgi:hypothetical protein